MGKKRKKSGKEEDGRLIVARNRRARHDYAFLEVLEAGVVLTGSEVKSLRAGKGSIAEAFARFTGNDLYIYGMHIPEYSEASYNNHETVHPRRLLLHRAELRKLHRQIKLKGLTIVPTELYFSARGWCKVALALAKGRREYDKRHELKKKDARRELRSYKR